MKLVAHISEEDLERYAMRTLPKAELERLEDHLRTCSECGDRLGQTESYVRAIRAAAARIRERGTGE